jgi:ABC-type sugar transport system ATPase subunit
VIAVHNLTLHQGVFALRDLTFQVPGGAYAVLMGRTGSGKTTLLEAVCGLRRIDAGSVVLMGREVTRLKPAERGIGYVPQDRALFPHMTVWQHLAFALTVRRWERQAIAERVGELAELLGLGRLLDRTPHGLSGGESQRVALGRALSYWPRVLLLDEPLSALDDQTREEMYALLRSVRAHTGVTTLHVTHSQAEAARLADRLLVLQGDGIEERPLANLSRNADLAETRVTEVQG